VNSSVAQSALASSVFSAALGRVVESSQVLERLDDHSDVLLLRFQAPSSLSSNGGDGDDEDGVGGGDDDDDALLLTPPTSLASSLLKRLVCAAGGMSEELPKEAVVERYWRVDEDGCYMVCLTSIARQLLTTTKTAGTNISSSTTTTSNGGRRSGGSGSTAAASSLSHFDRAVTPGYARCCVDCSFVVSSRRDYTGFHGGIGNHPATAAAAGYGGLSGAVAECRLELTLTASPGGAAASLRAAAGHHHFSNSRNGDEEKQKGVDAIDTTTKAMGDSGERSAAGSSSSSSSPSNTSSSMSERMLKRGIVSGQVGQAAGRVLRNAASEFEAPFQRRLLSLVLDIKVSAQHVQIVHHHQQNDLDLSS
jgi:hypothetical protein